MRITGGSARGIKLKSGNHKELRPAGDGLREAVFSSLGNSIQGARVVDLFAGTGAYGLEALSRGAAQVTFVEKNRKSAQVIEENIKALCKSARRNVEAGSLWIGDAFKQQEAYKGLFDIVFLDPPYSVMKKKGEQIMELAYAYSRQILTSRVVAEFPADYTLAAHPLWKPLKRLGKAGAGRPALIIFAPKFETS